MMIIILMMMVVFVVVSPKQKEDEKKDNHASCLTQERMISGASPDGLKKKEVVVVMTWHGTEKGFMKSLRYVDKKTIEEIKSNEANNSSICVSQNQGTLAWHQMHFCSSNNNRALNSGWHNFKSLNNVWTHKLKCVGKCYFICNITWAHFCMKVSRWSFLRWIVISLNPRHGFEKMTLMQWFAKERPAGDNLVSRSHLRQ